MPASTAPTHPTTPTTWGTVAQAADFWGVSTKTVRRWIARGDVSAVRLPGNRLLRVDLDSIQVRSLQPAS